MNVVDTTTPHDAKAAHIREQLARVVEYRRESIEKSNEALELLREVISENNHASQRLSITEISKILGLSRQSIYTMLRES